MTHNLRHQCPCGEIAGYSQDVTTNITGCYMCGIEMNLTSPNKVDSYNNTTCNHLNMANGKNVIAMIF